MSYRMLNRNGRIINKITTKNHRNKSKHFNVKIKGDKTNTRKQTHENGLWIDSFYDLCRNCEFAHNILNVFMYLFLNAFSMFVGIYLRLGGFWINSGRRQEPA